VAVIHAQRADMFGNVQIDGITAVDIDMAKASRKVIVTVEKIVPNEEIRRNPEMTKIPFFCVDAVVEVPFGAEIAAEAVASGTRRITLGTGELRARLYPVQAPVSKNEEPFDLRRFLERPSDTRTYQLLQKLGIKERLERHGSA
jgi:acyl CoA:acetate/3-ketoacid CoA transferase